MEKHDQIEIIIHEESHSRLKIELIGQLNIHTISHIWERCVALQKKYQPDSLIIETKRISHCDDAGITLLKKLQTDQVKIDKTCSIQNLSPRFQSLFNLVSKPDKTQKISFEEEIDIRTNIGFFTVNILRNFRYNIAFVGILFYQLLHTLLHPKSLRYKDMWKAAEDVGPQALPIIILIGFLIGLISTFQAAPSFGEFGVQIYLINLVSLGLVREMGPLMTAVLLAGRTASSFAAEIGTMKINQEIDALTTMGLNPVKFLTIPRVIATMIMTPILNVFLILSGLVGCAVVMKTLGYPLDAFLTQLYGSIRVQDCIGGLIKVFVFGFVIASVGCLYGLKTQTGSRAVGSSTTQAVVNSLIMMVVVDGVFASIYYVLGI